MYETIPLSYSFNDLSPYINEDNLRINYQIYRDNLDKLNTLLKSIHYDYSYSLRDLIDHIDIFPLNIRGEILYYLSSVLNHNLYFYNISNQKNIAPNKTIEKDIIKYFGNYEEFKRQFKNKAMNLKGSGYTFLVKDESASKAALEESTIKTKETSVNGADKELVIGNGNSEHSPDKLRLVVCTGDVRIRAGITFSGIIMAKGTITLEPGAKLLSSPLDAAKAFQSQMNNGKTSPKDFFWEGDKYVLGNSQTSNDSGNSDKDSDVYHIEDYVTYKNWERK